MPEEIRVEDIQEVSNVRTDTNDPQLTWLMEDITQYGLFHQIGVKKIGASSYNLIWGHRRFAAIKKLGWKKLVVDKHVHISERDMSEEDYIAINVAENIHRRDIDPIELGAVAIYLNEKKKMSYPEIAARFNVPVVRITLAVDTYLNTPDKYRNRIGFNAGKSKAQKASTISASTVRWVGQNIPPAEREKVLDEVEKKQIPVKFLRILSLLTSYGMPLDEAMEKMYEFRSISLDLLLKKSVADALEQEHNKPIHEIIRWFLKQGIRPKRDLIFDPEAAVRESEKR